MNTKKRFLFCFLCLVFLFFKVEAQKCHIKGKITNSNGSPIALATIKVEGQLAGGLTNLKGNYSFNFTSSDTVTIVYRSVGYKKRIRKLYNPSDTIIVNIRMLSTEISLNAVGVTAQRLQTGQTQRVDIKNAKHMASTTGNAVEDLISTQAGVSTHNEMSSQYNVRGGSFDENCVYLNGVEIFRPMLVRSGQQEGLSVINSDMVENIKFSAGGFEAKYGDKMSSVLDITYKRPTQFEGTASASLLGGGVYVGLGNNHFSMMNSVRYKTTKLLLGSLETNGEYSPSFFDYQSFLSWRPNENWTIDVIGNISDNHYQFAPSSRTTKFGTIDNAKEFKVYFDGQEKDYFRTYFASLSLTHHFSQQHSISLLASAFSTRENETYDIQGQYWLNETTSQQQLGVGTYLEHARNYLQAEVKNIGIKWQANMHNHRLQAGVLLRYEKVKEREREWEMRDSMGYSLPYEADQLRLIYSQKSQNDLETSRWEFYAQDTYKFRNSMGAFTLNYGARFSRWSWNGEQLFSPRISLGLLPKLNDKLFLRIASGVYYQTPFYKELRQIITSNGLSSIILNRNIKSQRSIHFVLGGDYNFKMMNRSFRFTTEAYYKLLDNLIPYTIDNLRVNYYGENMTNGYSTGIDFKLFGEFVPNTDSWITFSLMSTKEQWQGQWLSRPTDQRYNISLFFTDYFPNTDKWTMTLKAVFADGLPFAAPHSEFGVYNFRAPAYKRFDIGMSYRLLNNENKRLRDGWQQYLRNIWLGIDFFNVFSLNNVNSYTWITDVTNVQYAVPNYLTGRLVNFKIKVDF